MPWPGPAMKKEGRKKWARVSVKLRCAARLAWEGVNRGARVGERDEEGASGERLRGLARAVAPARVKKFMKTVGISV